jgi:hypothetical protein
LWPRSVAPLLMGVFSNAFGRGAHTKLGMVYGYF